MVFRSEDEALLGRLEDETALETLFTRETNAAPSNALQTERWPPRAAGLVALARQLPGGAAAVQAAVFGDAQRLVGLLTAEPLAQRPPQFVHHVALYSTRVAIALEHVAPEAAASAWTRAIAAWLALGEERAYLVRLGGAVVGPGVEIDPTLPATDVLADLGRRAEAAARDLATAGRAALLALSSMEVATRVAGVTAETGARAARAADRQRNAALDASLSIVGEALDDASIRDSERESHGSGQVQRELLRRAVGVWTWSGKDEAAEQFVVDKLGTLAWELYRAHRWDALRELFDPFRAIIDHFATRIERDASRIAFAAPCAQMYVFLADVEPTLEARLACAERAVRLCPTHRNGRLVLAALLCERATLVMRGMLLFARREEIESVAALLSRAEELYPECGSLAEAKAMLARVHRARIRV